ncbi:glycosyltransferase family 4 protein [Formosa sediminum]|uniref:Glycosyltransferase family 4 protein n=1 Tax=Formosa sediminum TaxID=2594004 RepID=A0A516GV67_9FLAO|nr:glycosyltransferase [Formosa sediminum]QDO95407.1 glycosyltransferase family 4 protein [Formosa sediminum]
MRNVLIIGFVWPEPKSSAAGSRMLQLIEAFQLQDYHITFSSPSSQSNQASDLKGLGIDQVAIELNNASFDTFISSLQPEIVIFDRFMMEEQFGWRVTEHCPDALKILDTEDLHCLRKGRQHAYKNQVEFNDTYLFNEVAIREIASIYRCDLTLMISEVEIEILTQKFKVPEDLLLYLPFMLDAVPAHTQDLLPTFNDREHFVTIGNFLHEPNYQTVLYLKQTLWPLIKAKLPKAELHIYGAYASQKVNQLHQPKDGFYIKGYAEDANIVMQQAKICIAPLVFGAGLKGKLIDAMSNGTPCAMSKVAAEGMFAELEPNGFVEDDAKIFAEKASELYTNEALWNIKQHQGFVNINTRFNKIKHQHALISHINSLNKNLKAARLQNFTGRMLQHHNMQSTKFMSRWIEEKNKHTNF